MALAIIRPKAVLIIFSGDAAPGLTVMMDTIGFRHMNPPCLKTVGPFITVTRPVLSVAPTGNGSKAGGYAGRAFNALPPNIQRNTIRFCLAVMNKADGFYSNHHLEGNAWYNNTAYQNGVNYNMLNRKAKTVADYLTDGPGYNHVLRNNISLAPRSVDITNYDAAACTIDHNSFLDNDITFSAGDFFSLDTSQLTAPRERNGNLPVINFMRLKPASKLIDKGIDIGLPFYGKAPDLGCFETNKK